MIIMFENLFSVESGITGVVYVNSGAARLESGFTATLLEFLCLNSDSKAFGEPVSAIPIDRQDPGRDNPIWFGSQECFELSRKH